MFGGIYLVIAAAGLIDGNDAFNLAYSGVADNIVHITLAVLGIAAASAAGWRPRRPRGT